ncbi:MAG: hypothetical protein CVU51_01080 [Deltaproteobacteria bacterium HGW-Deltaproteobacteria-1]|nr:MAG: hypothetical protein CVU51_01080 [Deltaproteobacteria bacterium HGW-Deltaproteobacteria-1]
MQNVRATVYEKPVSIFDLFCAAFLITFYEAFYECESIIKCTFLVNNSLCVFYISCLLSYFHADNVIHNTLYFKV